MVADYIYKNGRKGCVMTVLKVGDKVTILVGRHKGQVGIIEAIDYEWQYPYELEGYDELYTLEELSLYIEDEVKETEKESHVETEQSDGGKFYLIVYDGVDGRTLLFDPEEKLLLDEKYDVEPKENPYFMGFFDGLSHGGKKFVIKMQYLT